MLRCTRCFPVWYKTPITLCFSSSKPYETKKKLVHIALPVEQDVRTIRHLKKQSPDKRPSGHESLEDQWMGKDWVCESRVLGGTGFPGRSECSMTTVLLDSDHLSHRLVRSCLTCVRLQRRKTKDHQFCFKFTEHRAANFFSISLENVSQNTAAYLTERQRNFVLSLGWKESASVSTFTLHGVTMARLVQIFLPEVKQQKNTVSVKLRGMLRWSTNGRMAGRRGTDTGGNWPSSLWGFCPQPPTWRELAVASEYGGTVWRWRTEVPLPASRPPAEGFAA